MQNGYVASTNGFCQVAVFVALMAIASARPQLITGQTLSLGPSSLFSIPAGQIALAGGQPIRTINIAQAAPLQQLQLAQAPVQFQLAAAPAPVRLVAAQAPVRLVAAQAPAPVAVSPARR